MSFHTEIATADDEIRCYYVGILQITLAINFNAVVSVKRLAINVSIVFDYIYVTIFQNKDFMPQLIVRGRNNKGGQIRCCVES